jgi:hypothetical protein
MRHWSPAAAGPFAAGGDGPQLGLDPGDPGGLAVALHEQHAASSDRAAVVGVGWSSKGTGSRCRCAHCRSDPGCAASRYVFRLASLACQPGGYIRQQSGCIGVGFAIPADTAISYLRNGAIQRIIDASTGSGAWYYSQGRWARRSPRPGRFRIYWRYSSGWQAGPLGSIYRLELLWRLRRARHDLRAGLSGEPRLRPDDRPHDGSHVVLAVDRHARRDLQLVTTPDRFLDTTWAQMIDRSR